MDGDTCHHGICSVILGRRSVVIKYGLIKIKTTPIVYIIEGKVLGAFDGRAAVPNI